MRLNHPFLATPKVSHMLQTCWLAEPNARPSFSKIKELLLEDDLFPKSLVKKHKGFYQVPKEEIAMLSQYKSIQKCHPLYVRKNIKSKARQELSSIGCCSEDSADPESYGPTRQEDRIRNSTYEVNSRGYLLLNSTLSPRDAISIDPCRSSSSINFKDDSVFTTVTTYTENNFLPEEISNLPSDKDDVFENNGNDNLA